MWLILALLFAQDKYDAEHAFLQDATVNVYVQRIAVKLSGGVTARVVRDKTIRAASMPADRVYVTSGLVSRAANEAELAGVLAHEIAHLSGQAVIADTESGLCARFPAAKHPNDTGARERERVADEAAIRMLTAARYDPAEMIAFFSKLRRADLELPPAFSAEDLLLERLQLEATDHPLTDLVRNTPEFERMRARVESALSR